MAKKQATVSPDIPQATPETPQDASEIQQAASENIETVIVNSPIGLNLRRGPSKSFAVLKLLWDGEELSVHELPGKTEVPGWILVETAEGMFGWVCVDFLKAVES